MSTSGAGFVPALPAGRGPGKRLEYRHAGDERNSCICEKPGLPRTPASINSPASNWVNKRPRSSFIEAVAKHSASGHSSSPARETKNLSIKHLACENSSSQYIETVSADAIDESDYLPVTPQHNHSRKSEDSSVDGTLTFWAGALSSAILTLFASVLCALSGLPLLGGGWTCSPSLLGQALFAVVPFQVVLFLLSRTHSSLNMVMEEKFRAIFENRSLWQIGIFCGFVALGEELFFRSWLLAGLQSWQLPSYFALASSSIAFGIMHSYSREYIVVATVAGTMFGAMFLSSGQSLLQPLVVHFLYDFFAILVLQRDWLGRDKLQ